MPCKKADCGKTRTCFGPQALVQHGLVDAALGGPFNQFDPSDDDTCPIASAAVDAITMATGSDGIFLPCGSASDQAKSAVGGKGGTGRRSPIGGGHGGDLKAPAATAAANNIVRYNPDFAVGQIAQNGRARATDLIDLACPKDGGVPKQQPDRSSSLTRTGWPVLPSKVGVHVPPVAVPLTSRSVMQMDDGSMYTETVSRVAAPEITHRSSGTWGCKDG